MRLTAILAAALGAALLLAGPGSSQPTAATPAAKAAAAVPAPALATHTLDATDANAWLDGFVPYALKQGDIAGAVVVVVKDGQILTERGYGYADVKAQKPVDPKLTLFRPGSISKTFTWTAVMQLVEQGKLNLDADVNTYLDFKIPPRAGGPITLRDLLTHRPGFEEAYRDLITTDPKRSLSLEQYLRRDMPHRIFPAGQVDAYSNYGAALAGYIVQRVSGEPYAVYIQRHILTPLGMAHSSFAQPLPAAIASDMSRGYPQASAAPHPFEYVNGAPAGALASTGDDMGHYMIAHLQDGTYNGVQILKPETARDMQTPHFWLNPPLPTAFGWGFVLDEMNGRPTFGHNGATTLFLSNMVMFPTEKTGVFISVNSYGKAGAGGALTAELIKNFADRYFSKPPLPNEPTWPTAKKDARTVAGLYWPSRRPDQNLFRLASLFNQIRVSALPNGEIQMAAGVLAKWREVGPFVWRQVSGDRRRMAASVKDGKVVYLTGAWLQPVPWNLSAAWNLPLFEAAGAILALVVLLWPVSALVRRRYGRAFALTGRSAALYRLTRLGALAALLCLGVWAGVLLVGLSDLAGLNDRFDPFIRLAQVLGLLTVAGVVVAALNLAAVWRDGARGWWGKLSSLLILIAMLDVAWIVVNFHLLTVSTAF